MKRFFGLLMAMIFVFSAMAFAYARGPGKQNTPVASTVTQTSPFVAPVPVMTASFVQNNFVSISNEFAASYIGAVTTDKLRLSTTVGRNSTNAGSCDSEQCNVSDIGAHAYINHSCSVLRT